MTIPTPTTDLAAEDIAIGETETWLRPDREGIFAKLRAERPLAFFKEVYPTGIDDTNAVIPLGPGFWALTRYDDVMAVSRDADNFHSAPSTNITDIPVEIAEWLGSMINMDSPKHTRMRLIVNRAFTPRRVALIEDNVRAVAQEIVAAVAPLGQCDFVSEIAAKLPLTIICDMMGIPREDHHRIYELTNVILGVGDPEYTSTMNDLMAAGMELFQYGLALAESRLKFPTDDIASALVNAEIADDDGVLHSLTPSELGSFFLLLVAAGNETTRNAISHGLLALTENPEQRAIWAADVDGIAPTAVEEIVRWATPVIHFRRTAVADVVIGGQLIKSGDKVVMFYNSANRDERRFDDPYQFDVRRSPNEHCGFGAGGPHFCLGANLARREIRVMFGELFATLPDIHVSSAPDMLQSGFIHGIKRMQASWTPVNL